MSIKIEQYIGEIKSLINDNGSEVITDDYYEFEINKCSENLIKNYNHEFINNENKW